MKSRIFSITFLKRPKHTTVAIYRTIGRSDGGGIHWYDLTVAQLCRLLDAMCNTSNRFPVTITEDDGIAMWTMNGVVPAMYAAQATLDAEHKNG